MPSVVVVGNLVELLAGILSTHVAFLTCLLIIVIKRYESKHFSTERHAIINGVDRFSAWENGWSFNLAWVGTCIVFAILFPILFSKIYNTTSIVDSAPYIFAFLSVYLILMALWVLSQYVFSTSHRAIPYFILILVLVIAAIDSVYIYLLHDKGNEQYFIFILFIPPIFGIFANIFSNSYRDDVISRQQKYKESDSETIMFNPNNIFSGDGVVLFDQSNKGPGGL